MWADYDSEADALELGLRSVDRADRTEEIDETWCHVAMRDGEPVNISLLTPGAHLDLLDKVAERFDLDRVALLATAQAALAAPDHLVEVSVGRSLVA